MVLILFNTELMSKINIASFVKAIGIANHLSSFNSLYEICGKKAQSQSYIVTWHFLPVTEERNLEFHFIRQMSIKIRE